jgi:hypothetical protein
LKLKDEPAYDATRAQERHDPRFFSAVSAIFICVNSLIGQSGEEMHIRTDHRDCLRMFEFNYLQNKTIEKQSKAKYHGFSNFETPKILIKMAVA